MRFRSRAVAGVTVFAVAGVNSVSFGLRVSPGARTGLLGFAVQRRAPGAQYRYLRGFKVFPSVVPEPLPGQTYSTRQQPIQSLVWDDFTLAADTAYDYRFIPVRGTPARLRYGRPAEITVRSEPLHGERHTIVFNRGVASSQAYQRRFGGLSPDAQPTPAARQAALDWLSRDLDETFLAFVRSAGSGDALRGAFYEFAYVPVLTELAAARERGVDVRLVLDFKARGPGEATERAIAAAGLPADTIVRREARPSDIQHNKFLVLVPGSGAPTAVWTGSANLTLGGIHGQANVGHLVHDATLARRYLDYWELLATDPGGRPGAPRGDVIRANRDFEAAVAGLAELPLTAADIPAGVTALFSPRPTADALTLYADLLASPARLACATFAFGITKLLREVLEAGDESSPVRFLMLERRQRAGDSLVALDASRNIYQAWGSELRTPLGQWVAETTTRQLGLNRHVAFVHSKFLLHDPLGADPIVVTGSANFSPASCAENDENMVLIRGDRRVADIYFTEFNRMFFHYYFRSVLEQRRRTDDVGVRDDDAIDDPGTQSIVVEPDPGARTTSSLDLVEDDSWLAKYGPGTLRTKRAELFVGMSDPVLSAP